MDDKLRELHDIHWLMDIVSSMSVGIFVIDRKFNIHVWNDFMFNHSGLSEHEVIGKNIFKLFPDIPQKWLKTRIESVFALKCRAFTTWKERPFLFKFKNYRPITGAAEYMYQNIAFIPLVSPDTSVNHIAINLFDVTDTAIGEINLSIANIELEQLSRTDRLTNLNNRGYWEECMVMEFSRYQRYKQPISLLLFDIDHFKMVNDKYGHQFGDEVLVQTASIINATIRDSDIAGRYGGEEFAIILPGTQADGAMIMADRLRKAIANHTVHYNAQSHNYTISLGIAELTPKMADYKCWIECADKALYQSKQKGRNQATLWSE